MIGVQNAGFKYDPFGRRIYKSSSTGTSVFAYDDDELTEEVNSSGVVVARYSQGLNLDEPLAMLRGGTTSYCQADGMGSITSLSSVTGSLAQTYGYDSFGQQTSSSGSLTNPFQFAARDFDPETSLYYNRARYYEPATGRFLSEDPLQFAGGGSDFYSYSFNSPTNSSDPSGLAPGLLTRFLDWLKPTPAPPPPCPPKFNCDPDGYRPADPFERGQALAAATGFKGAPYGGKGPNSFDCSGLVCWAVGHSINGAFPNQGTGGMHNPQPGLMPIDPSQAGPGDIVLYPGHVGFYDPTNGKNDLFSARGDPADLPHSHGVDWAPRAGFKGAQQFFRLRVPCNK